MEFDNKIKVDDEKNRTDSCLPEPEMSLEEDPLSVFNKEWNAKLEVKRASEFEHDKAARAKAQVDADNWTTQREIRLTAKKDANRTEEHVVVEAIESERY